MAEKPCKCAMAATVPHTILVVEDEVLIRLMLADDLIQAGFQVIQAANAEDALKILQSSVKIDLVLTDIQMPGSLDGLDLARRVRARWPGLKTLILSAQHAGPARSAADAFLSKPYRVAELIDCVNQLLGGPNVKS